MTAADLAAARALCVSEDLSTWSMERLYGALYRLHAVLPRVLDECERLARVHTGHVEYGSAEHQEMYTPLAVRLMGERDAAVSERDEAREHFAAAANEMVRLTSNRDALQIERDGAIAKADVLRDAMNRLGANADALRRDGERVIAERDSLRAELARLQDWARAKLYAAGEPQHDRHVAEITRLTADRERWRPIVEAAQAWRKAKLVDDTNSTAPWVGAYRALEEAIDALVKEHPHGE